MAVTNQKSTQVTAMEATGVGTGPLSQAETCGKIRVNKFNFTQVTEAGDAGSTAVLARFSPGKYVFYPRLSTIDHSAFGASRTLALGISAYTDNSTTVKTAVALNAASLMAAADVSAAGTKTPGAGVTGGAVTIQSLTPFTVLGTVAGGTLPIGATLNGYLAYAVE